MIHRILCAQSFGAMGGYNKFSAIDAQKWGLCQTDPIPLDPEQPTWLGLDLSPDRKFGALVATQKYQEKDLI
jgi:hypothetical protein